MHIMMTLKNTYIYFLIPSSLCLVGCSGIHKVPLYTKPVQSNKEYTIS